VVPAPAAASLEQAATLPMNGLTALRGLELLGLAEGQWLLVSGGAGLLASYVIPLAARQGLRVIADAKPEEEELVHGFGAEVVVPRGPGMIAAVRETAPDGVAALYDTALLGSRAFPAIADGGQIAVVRGWDDSETERGIKVRPVWVREVLERTDWLELLSRLASDGTLALRVAGRYPPEQVAEAHRVMGAGGLRGRAVIVF
jgi:NADPH:quinone reductase-like Zn-dependent oxidoreductase